MQAQLTKNFSLDEFLVSQTAQRRGIDMTPDSQVIANLTRLCCEILQPLRKQLDKPIIVTSGYRPPELNAAIGGSSTSQHQYGLAADIVVPGMSVRAVCDEIVGYGYPFDQMINEYGRWTHVSVSEPCQKPRDVRLIAFRENGKTVYKYA